CDPGAPEDGRYGSQSAVVRLTSIVTSNFVNDVFVSAQRLFLNVSDGVTVQACGGDGITPLGITPAVNNGVPCPLSAAAAGNREDSLIPIIGSLGIPGVGSQWGAWSAGGNFFSATHSLQQSYLTGDQISWNHGKHSIRAGVNTQRIQWNWSQPNRERGWIVAGDMADILLSSSGPAVDGTPFVPANWLIESTNRLLPNGSPNPHHWRISEYSTYLEDDIKVTHHLTVNAGLRWEYDGWPSDAHGVFTNFGAPQAALVDTGTALLNNPVGTLAGYIVQKNYDRNFPGYNCLCGEFGSTGITVNTNSTLLQGAPLDNFSPRLGLAWQARDKLVVRAGYGMFFDRVYGNLVGDNILGNEPPYATGIGLAPTETLQDPYVTQAFLGFIPRTLFAGTAGAPPIPGAEPGFGFSNVTDINGLNATGLINSGDDPRMRTPKIQQYNLDVQYEFAHGWVLDVGYVGTHGIHLFDWNRDPNVAYLIDCGPASATCNPPTDQVNINLERPAGSFPINDNGNDRVLENTNENYLGRVAYLGVNPGNLQQVETDGNHLYNSLQAQLRHTFSHGLTMPASYTWSNLKTDINASEAGTGIATPGNVLSGSAS